MVQNDGLHAVNRDGGGHHEINIKSNQDILFNKKNVQFQQATVEIAFAAQLTAHSTRTEGESITTKVGKTN